MTSELLHESVGWRVDASTAHITLARPDAGNALDLAMGKGLLEAATKVRQEAEAGPIRVVLVDAEGPSFCVGGDLRDFAGADDRGGRVGAVVAAVHETIRLLQDAPVPVITVVHGVAAGGGVGLALSGDLVLIARTAKVRLAYTAAGLSPDCGASWLLPRVGVARALDLALTNRLVTGDELAQWGLASRAMDETVLAREATVIAAALARGPRAALAETKRLVRRASSVSLHEHLDAEASTIARLAGESDGREGVDAFLAKRSPAFL